MSGHEQTWKEYCQEASSKYEAQAAFLERERERIRDEWERLRAYCYRVMVATEYDMSRDARVFHVRVAIGGDVIASPHYADIAACAVEEAQLRLVRAIAGKAFTPEPFRLLRLPLPVSFEVSA